jgi:hypothetical protein
MTPAIRKLSNGDVVVDYGSQWFRLKPDGSVTARRTVAAGKHPTLGWPMRTVKAFHPTAAKIEKVKADIIALLPGGK